MTGESRNGGNATRKTRKKIRNWKKRKDKGRRTQMEMGKGRGREAGVMEEADAP